MLCSREDTAAVLSVKDSRNFLYIADRTRIIANCDQKCCVRTRCGRDSRMGMRSRDEGPGAKARNNRDRSC